MSYLTSQDCQFCNVIITYNLRDPYEKLSVISFDIFVINKKCNRQELKGDHDWKLIGMYNVYSVCRIRISGLILNLRTMA